MTQKDPAAATPSGQDTASSDDGLQPTPEFLPKATRLVAEFERLAKIGADPGGYGVSRLPFSQEEREAHRVVGGWMTEAGLTVRTDSFGNTIGIRQGNGKGLPAIGIGSHLDSVPRGGRFDGTVGVLGALEALRVFDEAGVVTEHPIWLVAFASEEGARFGEPCLGSRAVTGILEQGDLDRLHDADGVTLGEAMTRVGLDGSALPASRWARTDVAAFLELHIEQSVVLETQQKKIGLVDSVAGNTRLRLTMRGRADHSGGTPMQYRKDALAAAAEVVIAAEAIANEPRRRATVATVGRIENYPNSITTIPGEVRFYLDVRDIDSDRQRATASAIVDAGRQVAARRGIEFVAELISDTSPTILPMWLRELTTAVCRDMDLPHRVMASGAGHDAAILSRFIPAGMIFVPSHDGTSHAPEEWTSAEDIVTGVRVLMGSVRRVDQFLTGLGRNEPVSTS